MRHCCICACGLDADIRDCVAGLQGEFSYDPCSLVASGIRSRRVVRYSASRCVMTVVCVFKLCCSVL